MTSSSPPALANLFLCASPRSGSTQLATWLGTHPDITLSPVKEPNYFASQDFEAEYVARIHLDDVDPASYVATRSTKPYQFAIFREAAHYAYLFADMKTPWRLDASTTYLQSPGAAERIRAYNPDAMIVLLTRHPVERAVSHYRLAYRTGRTRRSLSEQIAAEIGGQVEREARFLLQPSRFNASLERFRAIFPPANLHELRFETLMADPRAALAGLAERLGIDPEGFDLNREKRNAGGAPRFPGLTAWAMESGLKPMIGRLVSPAVKEMLKRVMTSAEPGEALAPADRAALRAALADEVAAYETTQPTSRGAQS